MNSQLANATRSYLGSETWMENNETVVVDGKAVTAWTELHDAENDI